MYYFNYQISYFAKERTKKPRSEERGHNHLYLVISLL